MEAQQHFEEEEPAAGGPQLLECLMVSAREARRPGKGRALAGWRQLTPAVRRQCPTPPPPTPRLPAAGAGRAGRGHQEAEGRRRVLFLAV